MTTRRTDWPERLQRCVAERLAWPFEWGRHDCALFAADCITAVTDVDPAARLRGTYRTAVGARRVMRRAGGLAAVAAAGREEVAPLLAGAGDLGLVHQYGGEFLAVHTGSAWIAPADDGLRVVGEPARAWRV